MSIHIQALSGGLSAGESAQKENRRRVSGAGQAWKGWSPSTTPLHNSSVLGNDRKQQKRRPSSRCGQEEQNTSVAAPIGGSQSLKARRCYQKLAQQCWIPYFAFKDTTRAIAVSVVGTTEWARIKKSRWATLSGKAMRVFAPLLNLRSASASGRVMAAKRPAPSTRAHLHKWLSKPGRRSPAKAAKPLGPATHAE